MKLLETFCLGMDRTLPEFLEPPNGYNQINLGAGKKIIIGAKALDFPQWRAGQPFPYATGSVGQIYAFHFFEHLNKAEIISVFAEMERCLCLGGLVNMLMPHWSSEMAHQDLDHKSFWGETTLRNFLSCPHYAGSMAEARNFKFEVHTAVIMGIVQRNLAVMYQLRRI